MIFSFFRYQLVKRMLKLPLVALLSVTGICNAQSSPVDSLITLKSAQQTLYYLSGDDLKGRLTGSEGSLMAAAYIAAKFDSIGLEPAPGKNDFFDDYTANYEGRKIPAKNVVGAIPGHGNNDTMVIFSAHYDHLGQGDDLPYNKDYSYRDDIFNGANDNASGVTALLELARYFRAKAGNRYLLLFIAFSGEEMEMLGSTDFMKRTKAGTVRAVINLEMLGRPTDGKCFVVSFNNSAIRNMLNKNMMIAHPGTTEKFFENDPYTGQELDRRSDHYPFARKIKNAFTIMGSSPEDMYYHSVDDEYETIDFEFLVKATRNIAMACEPFTW